MAKLNVDDWALTHVALDTADKPLQDVFIAQEGDAKGRGIDLTVSQDGVAADMAGMSVYLAWGHACGAQGLTEFEAIDASKGHFKVYYPTQMQRRGIVVARIMVYVGSSGTPITGSRDFKIHVAKNPINEDAALTSDDFSVFQQAVIDLHKALDNFGTASSNLLDDQKAKFDAAQTQRANTFSASESARATAERTRVSAEDARKSNETARASAESSRVTVESGRASAESVRVSNETGRVSTETARVNAENTRATAEGTRKSNETARQTAERARVAAETQRETNQAKNNADQAINNAAMAKLTPYICGAGEYNATTLMPTITGEPNRMYFVPSSQGPGNVYVEWMLINNAWEMMGVSNVEISPISTAQIDAVAADQAPTGEDSLNLTGLSYLWAKFKAAFAPKSHASAATTHGAASASLYGHAKASQTTPLANGTAALGSETASFARGDHRHPLQTTVTGASGSCTGNAATATKLATARNIALSGDVSGSVNFDGSENATIAATIKALAVKAGMIADGAVTGAKIAAASVSRAKLDASLAQDIADLEVFRDSVSQRATSTYSGSASFSSQTSNTVSIDTGIPASKLPIIAGWESGAWELNIHRVKLVERNGQMQAQLSFYNPLGKSSSANVTVFISHLP